VCILQSEEKKGSETASFYVVVLFQLVMMVRITRTLLTVLSEINKEGHSKKS